MASSEPTSVIDADGATPGYEHGLSSEELLRMYNAMVLTRAIDDVCIKLQRSGRIGFSIPNRGIEATQVGAASALRRSDWLFPSYRDFGMALYHGVPAVEMMHNMFGNAKDSARGRQMPVHFSFVDPIHWVSISSPIGTHIPQAVGAAHAFTLRGEDRICMTSFGDGGTSSLGFHSGMNFAGVWKAPVVFLCQNNGYAISCPSSHQTASESYAIKGEAYGVPGVIVDGNDILAVRRAVKEAADRAREGGGPTIVECVTFRMGGHSTSDDPSRYVPKDLMDYWAGRDPIMIFERLLFREGVLDEAKKAELLAQATATVDAAAKEAGETPMPGLETIFSDVYAEIPQHIRKQGEEAFDLAARKGGAQDGGGEFPL
jgi:pyruvate dehydrogenase E1 component alpha subunit